MKILFPILFMMIAFVPNAEAQNIDFYFTTNGEDYIAGLSRKAVEKENYTTYLFANYQNRDTFAYTDIASSRSHSLGIGYAVNWMFKSVPSAYIRTEMGLSFSVYDTESSTLVCNRFTNICADGEETVGNNYSAITPNLEIGYDLVKSPNVFFSPIFRFNSEIPLTQVTDDADQFVNFFTFGFRLSFK